MYRILPNETLYDYNNCYKSGARKGKPRACKVLPLINRIEHPDFMEENNIGIDYKFYISNQIIPVKQVLDLEKSSTRNARKIFKDYI